MNCPMRSGGSSDRCRPRPCGGGSGWTTEESSTGSCGSPVPVRPGGMCPSGTGRGRHCPPALVGGPWTGPSSGCCGPRSPGLGRSRGRLTSKIRLACDAFGRPPAFVVTGGNINDCTQFTAVMEAIRVPRMGVGRPRVRPGRQGLQLSRDTDLAAATGNPAHHSPAGRPGPQPGPARQPGWASAGLRQAALQAA